MYIKSEASAQKENKREFSRKEQAAKREVHMVAVGDQIKCPECENMGHVVWVSQDQKTMGVQCPSHRVASRPQSKFGATVVPSAETKKNVVILTPIV